MYQWSVLLVDDHPLMRKGLLQLFHSEQDFSVIDEVNSGEEAILYTRNQQPDLIILDLNMKGLSGIETLKSLRKNACMSVIIVLTISNSTADLESVITAGGDGYLLKDSDPDFILEQIYQIMQGRKFFQCLPDKYSEQLDRPMMNHLTDREVEVILQVSKGLRNKEIADILFISEATVKVHMKNILKKLNVKSRMEAGLLYLDFKSSVFKK